MSRSLVEEDEVKKVSELYTESEMVRLDDNHTLFESRLSLLSDLI